MNQNFYSFNNDFTAVSLKDFKSNNLGNRNKFFKFLVINTFIALFLLYSTLYPINLYKKAVVKFFSCEIFIKKIPINIYNILFLIIGFYISLYIVLKISVQQFIVNKNETYRQRMIRLNDKWVVECEIWLVFLIIICLISIYRNAQLFNKELELKEKIKKIDEEIKNKENNANN